MNVYNVVVDSWPAFGDADFANDTPVPNPSTTATSSSTSSATTQGPSSESDASDRARPSWECYVCAGKTYHYNLGAKICRACCAFYKRASTEQLTFTCADARSCDLRVGSSTRVKCRACRLERCKEAIPKIHRDAATILLSAPPNSSAWPLLSRIESGYTDMISEQNINFILRYPQAALRADQSFCLKMREINELEKKAIPLTLNFFVNCFPPFTKLDKLQRVQLIKQAYMEFAMLHQAYLTSKWFPDPEDPRYIMSPRCSINMNSVDLDNFFDGFFPNPQTSEDYKQMTIPMFHKVAVVTRKYKQCKLEKIDNCALMVFAVSKHAEYLGFVPQDFDDFRDKVMREWSASLQSRFGVKGAADHLSQAMLLYTDVDDLLYKPPCRSSNMPMPAYYTPTPYEVYLNQSPENPCLISSLPCKTALRCQVCNTEISSCHLGAKVCRACAAFYKRSVFEGLRYKCLEGNDNCDLHSVPSSQKESPAQSPASCEEKTPKIKRMVDGYDEFFWQEHAYVRSQHPDMVFTDSSHLVPKKRCIVDFEREVANLGMNLFKNSFGPFSELSYQQRIKIVTDELTEFININRCFLTAKYCPDMNDQRLTFAPSYCLNPLGVDHVWWFDGYVSKQHIDAYLELTGPSVTRLTDLANRYKAMNMNKVDVVVLVMLSLWKHAEYHNLVTTEMKKFKDDVMEEWTWSLTSRFLGESHKKLADIMIWYASMDEVSMMMTNARHSMQLLTASGLDMDGKFCDLEQFMKDLRVKD